MVLVDTHCHLNFSHFSDDLDDVLCRASDAGIQRILVPGSDFETSRIAVELSEKYPFLYAAVGIHPNDASTWDIYSLKLLEQLANHPRVVAIGEIGLDYHHKLCPIDKQKVVLRSQLELAGHIGKPVILHAREALADLFELITGWKDTLKQSISRLTSFPGVFHSFEGDLNDALLAVNNRFFLGFGGPVTFRNALKSHNTAAGVPLDSMVLETDAPFLTPHPKRGQRNEPSYLGYIAQKIAALKHVSFQEVEYITTQNADRLFNWREL